MVNRKSLIGLTLKEALEVITMATNPLQLVVATEVCACVKACAATIPTQCSIESFTE